MPCRNAPINRRYRKRTVPQHLRRSSYVRFAQKASTKRYMDRMTFPQRTYYIRNRPFYV